MWWRELTALIVRLDRRRMSARALQLAHVGLCSSGLARSSVSAVRGFFVLGQVFGVQRPTCYFQLLRHLQGDTRDIVTTQ